LRYNVNLYFFTVEVALQTRYTLDMKKASVSIRFDDEIEEQLTEIANSSGIKKAAIVRQATIDYIQKIKHDGYMTIPITREARPGYGKKK